MKGKILNLALVLTSLIGYLEWGTDNQMFLFQGEALIIKKIFSDPQSVIHPFVLLPMFGQIILLITVFQKQTRKWFTIVGMVSIAVLLLLLFIISLMSLNYKILLSTLPFMVTVVLTSVYLRTRAKG